MTTKLNPHAFEECVSALELCRDLIADMAAVGAVHTQPADEGFSRSYYVGEGIMSKITAALTHAHTTPTIEEQEGE